jgi:hypothetical protein
LRRREFDVFFLSVKSVDEGRADGYRCHMFYEQRVVDIPDGLPKWSGMSGKSELIADSPPDEAKKRKREIEEEEQKEKESKSLKG